MANGYITICKWQITEVDIIYSPLNGKKPCPVHSLLHVLDQPLQCGFWVVFRSERPVSSIFPLYIMSNRINGRIKKSYNTLPLKDDDYDFDVYCCMCRALWSPCWLWFSRNQCVPDCLCLVFVFFLSLFLTLSFSVFLPLSHLVLQKSMCSGLSLYFFVFVFVFLCIFAFVSPFWLWFSRNQCVPDCLLPLPMSELGSWYPEYFYHNCKTMKGVMFDVAKVMLSRILIIPFATSENNILFRYELIFQFKQSFISSVIWIQICTPGLKVQTQLCCCWQDYS